MELLLEVLNFGLSEGNCFKVGLIAIFIP